MTWKHAFSEALSALLHFRQRTLVTVVSLGWGVACFLILMSYGRGFEVALVGAFRAVGQDLVLCFGGQTSQQAGGLRAGRRIQLDFDDATALKENIPLIAALSPEVMVGGLRVIRGNRENEGTIRAVWPEYQVVRNVRITEGRWINAEDDRFRNRVAVLGSKVAADLFSGLPAVGEEITINGLRFTVVGIMEQKLQISNYNRPDNECIFIPYQTASLFRDVRHPQFIVWMPVSPSARDDAIRMVRERLAAIHRFSPRDEQAVEILPFSKFMRIITGMSLAMQLLLGFVGALTLAIGGVGLANILLASVIDRTREIGMLKALGAHRTTILRQFLAEASAMVVVGAILGVALGYGITALVGSMPFLGPAFKDTSGRGDIRLEISVASIAVSLGVLLLVGLIAGMAPAIKASRLDPIEALRYE